MTNAVPYIGYFFLIVSVILFSTSIISAVMVVVINQKLKNKK